MPVTIEQVEDLLSRTLLPKPPKHVYVLDGVVDVPADGVAVAIGVARPKEDHVILTPLSRLDTVPHEGLHLRGFGEVAANVLGKLIALKYMLFPGAKKRSVKYQEVPVRDIETILRELGLRPAFRGPVRIKHYVLVEE